MTRDLCCYAYPNGETWEAICVAHDIATFGSNLKEVKESLVTCIGLFLEGVAEASPDDREHLLRRRSPWLLRVKLAALTWLSRLRTGGRQVLRFNL